MAEVQKLPEELFALEYAAQARVAKCVERYLHSLDAVKGEDVSLVWRNKLREAYANLTYVRQHGCEMPKADGCGGPGR